MSNSEDDTSRAEFTQWLRVRDIVRTIQGTSGERRLRWATKLWNCLDSSAYPEAGWSLMVEELPDCFIADGSVNSIRFTY